MRIDGFLQSYNGVSNGYLRRCLRSMAEVVDRICVYDDASTEAVWPLYDEFECVVIRGLKNEFHRELYHKRELLHTVLSRCPEWIVWFDSDAVLGRMMSTRAGVEETLGQADEAGYVRLHLRNLNLWRSNFHIRTDKQKDEAGNDVGWQDLWHGVFWKNTGELHYAPVPRLHQKQYPVPFTDGRVVPDTRVADDHAPLLHFGFCNPDEIAAKYFRYRAAGQQGFALNRLVDETGLATEEVPDGWYPEWLLDELERTGEPTPVFNVEEMAQYDSWHEWKADNP